MEIDKFNKHKVDRVFSRVWVTRFLLAIKLRNSRKGAHSVRETEHWPQETEKSAIPVWDLRHRMCTQWVTGDNRWLARLRFTKKPIPTSQRSLNMGVGEHGASCSLTTMIDCVTRGIWHLAVAGWVWPFRRFRINCPCPYSQLARCGRDWQLLPHI